MTKTTCVLSHKEPKTATNGHLCASHDRWIHTTLTDILDTIALLPYFYEPGTATDDGRQVRGKRIDPPAPVRLDIVAIMDPRTTQWHPADPVPVLGIIESWARLVREERNLEQPTTPAYLSQEVQLLTRHHTWITEQPWVNDYADELRSVQTALRNAIGDSAPRPVGTCPITHETGTCAGLLYQDRYGRLSVTCRKCGEVWGETELRRLGLVIGL